MSTLHRRPNAPPKPPRGRNPRVRPDWFYPAVWLTAALVGAVIFFALGWEAHWCVEPTTPLTATITPTSTATPLATPFHFLTLVPTATLEPASTIMAIQKDVIPVDQPLPEPGSSLCGDGENYFIDQAGQLTFYLCGGVDSYIVVAFSAERIASAAISEGHSVIFSFKDHFYEVTLKDGELTVQTE